MLGLESDEKVQTRVICLFMLAVGVLLFGRDLGLVVVMVGDALDPLFLAFSLQPSASSFSGQWLRSF